MNDSPIPNEQELLRALELTERGVPEAETLKQFPEVTEELRGMDIARQMLIKEAAEIVPARAVFYATLNRLGVSENMASNSAGQPARRLAWLQLLVPVAALAFLGLIVFRARTPLAPSDANLKISRVADRAVLNSLESDPEASQDILAAADAENSDDLDPAAYTQTLVQI